MNCATSSALVPAIINTFPPIAADSSTSGGPRPCWPSWKPRDGTLPPVREHGLSLLAGGSSDRPVRRWGELKEGGFTGAYRAVKRGAAVNRPAAPLPIEVRFET